MCNCSKARVIWILTNQKVDTATAHKVVNRWLQVGPLKTSIICLAIKTIRKLKKASIYRMLVGIIIKIVNWETQKMLVQLTQIKMILILFKIKTRNLKTVSASLVIYSINKFKSNSQKIYKLSKKVTCRKSNLKYYFGILDNL